MLTFNLKKQWFDKIKSGEKMHEYREVKSYWKNRLLKQGVIWGENAYCSLPCEFVLGYAPKNDKSKRLNARIRHISIINGKNTDLAIDKDVYDIEFELIGE